jgi:hypothetical protein
MFAADGDGTDAARRPRTLGSMRWGELAKRRLRRIRGRHKVPLTPAILAWRAGHAAIALTFLSSIAYIWWSALTDRRGRLLRPAVVVLAGEGALVAGNRGDCPLGGLGERIGDPVPLFELVLPPRAAKRAIPVLAGVTAAGVALLAARSRR